MSASRSTMLSGFEAVGAAAPRCSLHAGCQESFTITLYVFVSESGAPSAVVTETMRDPLGRAASY